MTVFLDSGILIEVTRGRDFVLVENWLRLTDSDAMLLCSPVSVAELWQGARPKEHRILEALFSSLAVAPIDAAIGHRAGSYLRSFRKSHGLQLGDALVAASAATHEAALWTRNRKHYPMEGLKFYR